MWKALILLCLVVAGILGETVNFALDNDRATYSFDVDYRNDQFLLDGRPFRYVSGSFHYFRTPKVYWRDRLRKMRAAGLNAVSTYVEWSLHQPTPNTWQWTGEANLLEFLDIAQEEDLLVLLRPGPYICAERDLGGLPTWLLTLEPTIRLRTNDERYMRYVEAYLNTLLEKVKPYFRGNGGPIIMVQVENEYGSYNACDTNYMNRLRNIFDSKVQNKALLFTTDGHTPSMLRCGMVPGAYATVDFGTGANVTRSFGVMRLYQPRGPLVNSEFYPGWLTHWKEPFQRVKTTAVTKTLDEMLAVGASVNIYMFYGGTNFQFTSGANGGEGSYSPQLTSYDYDAPLTEAGDYTDKYFAIRDIISKYLPLPRMPLPPVSPKGDYGPVLLEPLAELFSPLIRRELGSRKVQSDIPLTFEALNVPHGFVLYETNLPPVAQDPTILQAMTRDRALVYVDQLLAGTLSRIERMYAIPLENPYGRRLQLLVENQGHLNYGNEMHDFKGISQVMIGDLPLSQWDMTAFPLAHIRALTPIRDTGLQVEPGVLRAGPVFLRGYFTVAGEPRDTYLDTTGWGKGVAFVNGHNLGRYWPLAGPQMTLYIPGSYLKTGENELVLLELEYMPNSRKMKLQDTPNLSIKTETFEEEDQQQNNGQTV